MIVNVAFIVGIRSCFGFVWYNIFKGAMMSAIKVMVIELALDKICVNAINFVAGETGMLYLFMGEDMLEK